jgi:zinc protease
MVTSDLTATPAAAVAELPAIPPDVRVRTLDNGLILILREDHSAPVVSAQAWCMAGSINEGRWLGAGLSHVLEHMLFKGTDTRPVGRIDQEVQEAGGYMNAYTSFDRTVYWINVPNTGARVAIDVLADIIQHACLPPEELEKEKQVILREMDMNQDDPSHRSARRLFEVSYTRSPYRFTVIGYPDIFHQVRREDLVAYYREKYAPNNVFFVVVGDMAAGEVEAQVRAAFAQAKTRPSPPDVLPEEPKQMAPREVIEEASIELAHFHYSWHIPELRHPDVPLLDILATLLGGGRSSRLYQQVRERQGLVTAIDAWTYSPGNSGLFGISAMTEAAKLPEARRAIFQELERIKRELVGADELAKVVRQFVSGTLASRKTMQGQAQDLGYGWMVANDLNFSTRYLEAVKRVTPAALQRVAAAWFTSENRTAYALVPSGTTPKPAGAASQYAEKKVQKFDLTNGVRLLVQEDHRLPFVEFRAVLEGGVLAEAPRNNGASLLLAKMLLQGTPTRSAEQIAREIESLGGHIETFCGNNSFGVNLEVLADDFNIGVDALADVLLHPTLPAEAFERERQLQLASIRAQKDELLSSAFRLMRRTLFGDVSYGLHTNGTEASVQRLVIADLQALHQRLVVPHNCVLAVFGDVQAEAVRAAVENRMGAWPPGPPVLPTLPPGPQLKGPRHATETHDKKQAVLAIGFSGVTLKNEERYALELIQEACSDLGSRLFLRIREKLGLAYYVGAQNLVGLAPGYFAFYAGTEPEKAALVESEILQEAALLRAEGLTAQELRRAKAKVIGQKKIARQDLGNEAMTAALDELFGLGYRYSDTEDARFEAVTIEQTRAVAQKYLRSDAAVVAWLRPGTA